MPIHWNNNFASNATVSALYQSKVDPISGQPEAKHTGISVTQASFSQYIDVYIADEIHFNTEYWLKAKLAHCYHYQLAANSAHELDIAKLQEITNLKGEWLSFNDESSHCSHIICLNNGKVIFAAFISTYAYEHAQAWVDELFSEELLDFTQVQALLTQTPVQDSQQSRKVCSCFNVSENEIVEAIATGCNSVKAIGNKLKCGTNCGSCKPEIQSLLNEHVVDENVIAIATA